MHGVHVLQHVARGNAYDSKSPTTKNRISSGIALRLITEAVTLTVDFDHQALLKTGEVDRDLSNWTLPPKLKAFGPAAKDLP